MDAGRHGGYRSMWHRLQQQYRLRVTREDVRRLLQQVDPIGVAMRRQHRLHRRTYVSRGPNDAWHVDGYDKLRPYGILINGYGLSHCYLSLHAPCVCETCVTITFLNLDNHQQHGPRSIMM